MYLSPLFSRCRVIAIFCVDLAGIDFVGLDELSKYCPITSWRIHRLHHCLLIPYSNQAGQIFELGLLQLHRSYCLDRYPLAEISNAIYTRTIPKITP